MELNTRHFGRIQIEEKNIIDFPEGIPGFLNVKKFVVLYKDEENDVFMWLQSVDEPNLAFVIVNPFLIREDYDFEIDERTVEMLNIETPEDVMVYSIVVVPEDLSKMSINLKAPIIINMKNNKGAQIILDNPLYGVRHYITEELKKQEETGDVSSNKEEGAVYCNK